MAAWLRPLPCFYLLCVWDTNNNRDIQILSCMNDPDLDFLDSFWECILAVR